MNNCSPFDIELAQKGDKEAFSRLIEDVKYKLYKIGMSILNIDKIKMIIYN